MNRIYFVILQYAYPVLKKDRQKVSEAITGVAPDLLTSLPHLFPDLFGATAPEGEAGPPEHRGRSGWGLFHQEECRYTFSEKQ